MASERQAAANRRNARRSTGPKSQAGRRRAAGNARKHGLSIINNDADEINKLASKIAGATHDFEIQECSWIIAAAEIELRRIRRVRVCLFQSAGVSAFLEHPAKQSCEPPLSTATPNNLRDLQSIQRYEQRTIARRDKALRRLVLLKFSRKD